MRLEFVLCGMVSLLVGCGVQTEVEVGTPTTNAPSNQAVTDTNRQVFEVRGVIKEVKLDESRVVINHEEIPDYMPAMTMPFQVKSTNELAGIASGDQVKFNMVVTEDDGWIENIQKVGTSTNDPAASTQRQSFRLVRDVEILEVGDTMPDYSFTNSLGEKISFSDYKGQALAFTFIFTRCPFPTFCPRMNSNFADAYKKLIEMPNAPTNWHMFSISFDPDYDTPERLRAYSEKYNPDPKKWNWVTGAMIDIDAITEQFGLAFAVRSGTIDHNLRTVIVDANGKIQEIIIGNEWQPQELVDGILKATRPTGDPKPVDLEN